MNVQGAVIDLRNPQGLPAEPPLPPAASGEPQAKETASPSVMVSLSAEAQTAMGAYSAAAQGTTPPMPPPPPTISQLPDVLVNAVLVNADLHYQWFVQNNAMDNSFPSKAASEMGRFYLQHMTMANQGRTYASNNVALDPDLNLNDPTVKDVYENVLNTVSLAYYDAASDGAKVVNGPGNVDFPLSKLIDAFNKVTIRISNDVPFAGQTQNGSPKSTIMINPALVASQFGTGALGVNNVLLHELAHKVPAVEAQYNNTFNNFATNLRNTNPTISQTAINAAWNANNTVRLTAEQRIQTAALGLSQALGMPFNVGAAYGGGVPQ